MDRSMVDANIFLDCLVYKEYPYRLILLFLYYSLLAISQISLVTFSAGLPIFTGKQYFKPADIILYSYICPITWALFTLPAVAIIKRINNNKIIMRVACGLLIVGTFIKIASYVSPVFIVFGQILSSCGNVLIARSSAKICHNWWAFSKRDIVIQVQDTAIPIGFSLGLVIPGLFEMNTWSPNSYLTTEAVIVSIFAFLAFILFKDKPRTPPSKFSEFEVPDIIPSIKSYFYNRNFVLIFICFSLVLGVSLTLMIYFPLVITNFKFALAPFNLTLGISLLFGLIVAFLFTVLKGKYKDPLALTLLQMSIFIGATCLFSLGLAKRSTWLLYIGSLFSICSLLPLPSFLYSVLTNYVHEFHEGLVPAVFNTGGSLFSLILGGVMAITFMNDQRYSFYGCLFAPIALLLCMVLLLLLKK